jgi:hypothetical protein
MVQTSFITKIERLHQLRAYRVELMHALQAFAASANKKSPRRAIWEILAFKPLLT